MVPAMPLKSTFTLPQFVVMYFRSVSIGGLETGIDVYNSFPEP